MLRLSSHRVVLGSQRASSPPDGARLAGARLAGAAAFLGAAAFFLKTLADTRDARRVRVVCDCMGAVGRRG